MAKLDSLDVVWHSILLPGHARDLARIHIEEFGLLVEKPADQPRAGDPVHGGILPGHKSHRHCPHLLPCPRAGIPRVACRSPVRLVPRDDFAPRLISGAGATAPARSRWDL